MLALKVGTYIKSTDSLNGSFFEYSTIQLVEHNEKGSLGFVINKPFGKSLNELIEFNYANPFPLMDGGPVDREHLFVLHSRPDLINGGKYITNELYLGGDMKQVINAINNKFADQDEIKLFIGYCGWDAGELKAEMEEGSWDISY